MWAKRVRFSCVVIVRSARSLFILIHIIVFELAALVWLEKLSDDAMLIATPP